MVTCFICFIRSRRKEDRELMEQVQYSNTTANHQQQQQYGQQDPQLMIATPQRNQNLVTPSENYPVIAADSQQQSDHTGGHRSQSQLLAEYQVARSSYAAAASSPYHTPSGGLGAGSPRTEIRSDITQQINSAIIGSSEAEFQNDFIQVSAGQCS